MQGNPQIIAELNKLLKNELTAINQYFLHARMMKHWGFERLAKKIYEESIGEMKHADKLMQAHPACSTACPTCRTSAGSRVGETVVECLKADLQAGERGAHRAGRRGHALRDGEGLSSAARSSSTSSRMPRSTSISSRPSSSLVDKVGEQNYLQTQIGEGKESS